MSRKFIKISAGDFHYGNTIPVDGDENPASEADQKAVFKLGRPPGPCILQKFEAYKGLFCMYKPSGGGWSAAAYYVEVF